MLKTTTKTALRSWKGMCALALILVVAGATSAMATSHGVCTDPAYKKIPRLGTSGAYSRTPITSPNELAMFFEERRAEVEGLLGGAGMGDLVDAFYKALRSDQITDAQMPPGTTFDWMLYRRAGKPYLGKGPFCLTGKKTYDAYDFKLVREEATCEERTITTYEMLIPKICANLALQEKRVETQPVAPVPPPDCELKAARSCEDRAFMVDASGSSPGAQVTFNGQPVDLGAGMKGEVADPDPFASATFVVSAETDDPCAKPPYCKREVVVPAEPRPTCDIQLSVAEARVGEAIEVDVTGHWDDLDLAVTDSDGNPVDVALGGPFPTTIRLRRAGTYTITGSAATNCGTGECSASVKVTPRWTVRGFGVFFLGDDELATTRITPVNNDDNLIERINFKTESSNGLGLNLEYRLSDRLGIEGGLMVVDVDTELSVAQTLEWGGQELYREDAFVDESLDMLALTIGPNFHLTPDGPVDVYVGPFIGVAQIEGDFNLRFQPQGDLTPNRTESRDSDEVIWGAQLGVDIPVGKTKRWAVHLGALYMDVSTDGFGGEADIGPFAATAGLAYNF